MSEPATRFHEAFGEDALSLVAVIVRKQGITCKTGQLSKNKEGLSWGAKQ